MSAKWPARLAAALSTGILLHHLLTLSLQSPPGPDEGMYLSAASLARDHAVYTGFSYLQAPYLPLLLAPALRAFDETSALLVGRVATFLHHVVALGLLFLVARAYTRDSVFSLLFVLFLALQGFVFWGGATLHNSTFANTYALSAFLLLLLGRARTSTTLLAGASLAVAIGMKLTHAPLLVPFLAANFSHPRRRALPPFLCGLAAGAAPMCILAARDPQAFWFNNLGWHRAAVAEADAAAPFRAFLRDAWAAFSDVTWAGPLVVIVLYLLFDWNARRGSQRDDPWDRVLLLLVPPVYGVAVAAVGQFRYWYLEPALYFGGLLVPCLYASQPEAKRRATRTALLAATAVLFAIRAPSFLETPSVLARDQWISSRLREAAASTRAAVEQAGGGAIAALGEMPQIYAVEARLPLLASTPSAVFECANAQIPLETRRRFHLATIEEASSQIEGGTLTALAVRSFDCSETDARRTACDASTCRIRRRLDSIARKTVVGAKQDGLGAILYTRPRRDQ